jgi:spore maturation protein B
MTQLTTLPYYVVLLVLVGIPVYGAARGLDVYGCFIAGASNGLRTIARIAPAMIAMFVAVGMFRDSGALDAAGRALQPAARALGIHPDLMILAALRPISGSGALGYLAKLLEVHGPDSAPGLLASVIQGSADTSLYIIALYFGSVGITRTRHTVPAALLAGFVGFVAAVVICRFTQL